MSYPNDVSLIEIEIKTDVVGKVRSFMETNMDDWMGYIADIAVNSVQENFKQQGRPTKWIPSIRAIRQNGMTLIDQKRLYSSIGLHNIDRKYNEITLSPKGIHYARYHQLGYKGIVNVSEAQVKAHEVKAFTTVKGITVPKHTRKAHTRRAHSKYMNLPARPFLQIPESDFGKFKDAGNLLVRMALR
jgi:phage gpG-like protein